ncbi:MAG: LPS export ABC transporter periplasmic protein LptC [Chitinispirillales bacterium]|jgi:LPS export ABC transporter protein LptC|nr:LPS export ABC transporter periplasmic protein LptC [Chitinispirillales bacterium]
MRILKLIIVAVTIFFCSCSQKKSGNVILSNDSMADSVSQILNLSKITAYRNGNKIWELNANEIIQISENKRIKANPVKLLIYDETAILSAVLYADSAISNESTDSLFVWGNVKFNAESGEKLFSNSLEWNKRKKMLLSNDFVELKSADGEVMRGKGFKADESFKWWEFAQEVTGNFPSVDAEFEKNED